MCGIIGFVGQTKKQDLTAMLAVISHRGPDENGIYWKKNVGLGHSRLSIIGVRNGTQPMKSLDNTLVITFNGEIYNYLDLKKSLTNKGYSFKTDTDTEVILAAYREYGEECPKFLDGMFAFAIWDDRNQRLFLARDRFGIKPLAYTVTPRNFLFSSEIKGLLSHPSVKKDVNISALQLYLRLRYVPEPLTMFSGIYHLPAAHYMIINQNKQVKLVRYWNLSEISSVQMASSSMNSDQAKNKFLELLEQSVAKQTVGESGKGIFVSGGIDSSLLTAITKKKAKNISLFSVKFKNPRFDESSYAERLAQLFHLKFNKTVFSDSWLNELPQIIWHLDQPLADPAALALFFLSQNARSDVKIIFSGDGADEILAGYHRYKVLKFKNFINSRFNIGCQNHDPISRRISTYISTAEIFSEKDLEDILNLKPCGLTSHDLIYKMFHPFFNTTEDILIQAQKAEMATWLPSLILLKTDRMTMAHGLEARVPYLDHRLVEFVFTLPSAMKLNRFTGKFIQRLAAMAVLPTEIINRRKHGFDVPLEPFSKLAKKILSEKAVKRRGWFRYPTVKNIMDNSLFSRRSAKQTLTLLVLEVWAQIFLDNKTPDQVIYSIH